MNKMANVENVVCSVATMSAHPELYHYTKPAAFEGIVGSQTLWCSHYREMLDTDEVRLMRDLLPQAVAREWTRLCSSSIGNGADIGTLLAAAPRRRATW
jgi:hypothetical protein